MVKKLKITRLKFPLMLLTVLLSSLMFFAFESKSVMKNARYRTDPQMVYVPGGAFYMGASDEQVDNSMMNHKKLISVSSFWMDRTEITNEQYRRFVNFVTDSLMFLDYSFGNITNAKDTQVNWTKVADIKKILSAKRTAKQWEDIISTKFPDITVKGEDRINGHPLQLDPTKLIYYYTYIDVKKAANSSNSAEGLVNARHLFKDTVQVAVYPDTLVWGRDFSLSENDPLMLTYFSHKAFNDYPVVGVSWVQATAFCHWRTEHSDYYQGRPGKKDLLIDGIYRLPSEAEWEYAARSNSKINAMFPWGAPYARTREGRLMANFKPGRGDYFGGDTKYDGITTVKVKSYTENGFGLFDMAGNVAEWTSTVFDEEGGQADFNPNFKFDVDNKDLTLAQRDPRSKKSIRGGSWKDNAYNCQVSTRNYDYQFNSKSYIGFRCLLNAAPKY